MYPHTCTPQQKDNLSLPHGYHNSVLILDLVLAIDSVLILDTVQTITSTGKLHNL